MRNARAGRAKLLFLPTEYANLLRSRSRRRRPCLRSLFTQIIVPRGKNIIIGTTYRPPNQNVNEFLASMRNLLTIVTKENKIFYVMGDFNLDLLHHEQHPLTGEFVDLMFSHLLYPLITKPTRLTSNTASY